MDIRAEQPGDAQGIFELTERAFAPMAYSDGSEAPLVAKLRETGDLTLSLVAVAAGRLIGHVAFSPVRIAGEHLDAAGGGWFGLGPTRLSLAFSGAVVDRRWCALVCRICTKTVRLAVR